jgi:uncharacterized membrane protein
VALVLFALRWPLGERHRGPTRKDIGASANVLSARRALIALLVGAMAGAIGGLAGAPEVSPVVGWIAAAGTALTWVWRTIWRQDPVGTERLAEAEARSRTTDTAVLVAAVISLGAIVIALVVSSSGDQRRGTAAVVLSVIAVAMSWMLVNTIFALKYARLYYLEEDGGIDFKGSEPPAYSDFAYVAFTVGMAFGPAETEPNTSAIRKVTLGHALLSYVFATGFLAVAVNLVTNLAG